VIGWDAQEEGQEKSQRVPQMKQVFWLGEPAQQPRDGVRSKNISRRPLRIHIRTIEITERSGFARTFALEERDHDQRGIPMRI
jgi:hypothetical protein